MLTIHTKRYFKFAKVEQATVWMVFAIAVEQRGEEIIQLSEPRLVKVIPKTAQAALTGSVSKKTGSFLLAGDVALTPAPERTVASPYYSHFATQTELISWYSARPPTR